MRLSRQYHQVNLALCWGRQGREPWRRALLQSQMARLRLVARFVLRERPELLKHPVGTLSTAHPVDVNDAIQLYYTAAHWLLGDKSCRAPLAAVLLLLALALLEAVQPARLEPDRSPPRPPPLILTPTIRQNAPNASL